jgi:23S rRNA pseudouridine2605 synthase
VSGSRPSGPRPDAGGERLQKVLAAAGLGSRRSCEVLIASGRVTVDGGVVSEQGRRVDPRNAEIRVDGSLVVVPRGSTYLALNKPRGVVSTMADPSGRACLADFVARQDRRLFHVGRLDADTEGLILLTNDGDLAHRLTHPSFGIAKTYLAEVTGPVPRGYQRALRRGVDLEDGPARADRVQILDHGPRRALVEVVVHEGRSHLVRRMLAAVGTPVVRLARTGIGPIELGSLRSGRSRPLSSGEVSALLRLAGSEPAGPLK